MCANEPFKPDVTYLPQKYFQYTQILFSFIKLGEDLSHLQDKHKV